MQIGEVQLRFPKVLIAFLLAVFCTFIAANAVLSQQVASCEMNRSAITTTAASNKQQLAKEVLSELGIARRYDLYFDHAMGLVLGPGYNASSKFSAWLREILAQNAGWKCVENEYAARLEADFSEAELQELLELSEQPVMKKLLRSETQAYIDTAQKRFDLLNAVWENYQEGNINPPPDVLP